MEGTATIQSIVTAITGLAGSVSSNALDMIAAVLPVLATVIAAIIVASLGVRMVKRFSN